MCLNTPLTPLTATCLITLTLPTSKVFLGFIQKSHLLKMGCENFYRVSNRLDWVRLSKVLRPSRHIFRSFRRRWGWLRHQPGLQPQSAPQCVRCWVVRARPLLITVVCMCSIWKALCPYVLDAWLELSFCGTHLYLCIHNQSSSSTAHLLAGWQHESLVVTCSVQGGGPSVIPTTGIHYKLRRLQTWV